MTIPYVNTREPEDPCEETGGPCLWTYCCDHCGTLYCARCSRDHDDDRLLWCDEIGPEEKERER